VNVSETENKEQAMATIHVIFKQSPDLNEALAKAGLHPVYFPKPEEEMPRISMTADQLEIEAVKQKILKISLWDSFRTPRRLGIYKKYGCEAVVDEPLGAKMPITSLKIEGASFSSIQKLYDEIRSGKTDALVTDYMTPSDATPYEQLVKENRRISEELLRQQDMSAKYLDLWEKFETLKCFVRMIFTGMFISKWCERFNVDSAKKCLTEMDKDLAEKVFGKPSK
jgi:hypothetical protein